MRKKERYEKILAWFRENRPIAETELHYNNPYELLIAVILSAQCTDKRVNMITPALYRDFPTPRSACSHYSGSSIRIHTQRILPEQQGQASCRHGSNAGERLQQPSPRHTGKARETSRCGTQNGKCNPVSRLQQSRHGGRYPCFPRQPPFGTGIRQMHHPCSA